jgi:hypothetical protein
MSHLTLFSAPTISTSVVLRIMALPWIEQGGNISGWPSRYHQSSLHPYKCSFSQVKCHARVGEGARTCPNNTSRRPDRFSLLVLHDQDNRNQSHSETGQLPQLTHLLAPPLFSSNFICLPCFGCRLPDIHPPRRHRFMMFLPV